MTETDDSDYNAREQEQRNLRFRVRNHVRGGLALVLFGWFMIALDVVHPSKGSASRGVGLGFVALGALFAWSMPRLLRRNARRLAPTYSAAMTKRAKQVGQYLDRHGSLVFYRLSRKRGNVGFWVLMCGGAFVVFCIEKANKGQPLNWGSRSGLLMLSLLLALFVQRLARGEPHRLTRQSLLAPRRGSFTEIKLQNLTHVGLQLTSVDNVQVQIKLLLETPTAKLKLAGVSVTRHCDDSNESDEKPKRELTRDDVLCFLWLRYQDEFNLGGPPD